MSDPGRGRKFLQAITVIAIAEIALFASQVFLPGTLVDQMNTAIRTNAPSFLQNLQVAYILPIVVGPFAYRYVDAALTLIKSIYPRFDEKTFRRIAQAKAFDPLRGSVLDHASTENKQDAAPVELDALPFYKARVSASGNAARRDIWNALSDFAQANPERKRLKELGQSDFAWTVIAGPSGIGKTRLALEFGRHLAQREAFGGTPPKASLLRRATQVVRTSLRLRSVTHPWDAGWIESLSAVQPSSVTRSRLNVLERLKSWTPRKPTYLLLDDPLPDDAKSVVQILNAAAERGAYNFVVRLVIVGPAVPEELELSCPDERWETSIPRFSGQLIIVPETAGFDVEDVKHLALHPDFREWLRPAILDRSPTDWGDRFTESIRHLLIQSEGNPFLFERLISAMKQGSAADAFDKRRLLRHRAAGLLRALSISGLDRSSFPLLAAATLARGTEELNADARRSLFQSFPAASLPTDASSTVLSRAVPAQTKDQRLDLWLPAVRPRIIGISFVRALIESIYDKENAASNIVAAAWRVSPGAVLQAKLEDRLNPVSDLLSDLLATSPPPDSGLSKLDIAKAYITSVLVVTRAAWDRGASDNTESLRGETGRLIDALSIGEAREALHYIRELAEVERSQKILRGSRAVSLLVAISNRLSNGRADRSCAIQDFWSVYETAKAVERKWGGLASHVTSNALIHNLRSLKATALTVGGELMHQKMRDAFGRLATEGHWPHPEAGLLIAVASCSFEPNARLLPWPDEPTDLDLLVYCHSYSRAQYEHLNSGTPHPPPEAVKAMAAAHNAKSASDLFSIALSIACLSCLPSEATTVELERVIDRIGQRPELDERATLRLLAIRTAFLANQSNEMNLIVENELRLVADTSDSTILLAAVALAEIAGRRAERTPATYRTKIELGISSIFLGQPRFPVEGFESAFLTMMNDIGRHSDEAKTEGENFRKAWIDARALALTFSDRWVGHESAEAQFGRLLAGRSRAFRSSPDETREAAREISYRLRPLQGSHHIAAVVLEGWRLHAFSLSENATPKAMRELTDLITSVDQIVQEVGTSFLMSKPHACCHEYYVRALTRQSLDSTAALMKHIEVVPAHMLTRETLANLAGSFDFTSRNVAVSPPFRQASARYAWLIFAILGVDRTSAELGTPLDQTEPLSRQLHEKMLPVLASLVASEAPINNPAAVFICQVLENTANNAGLNNDPHVTTLIDTSWDLVGGRPFKTTKFESGTTAFAASYPTNSNDTKYGMLKPTKVNFLDS